VSNLLGLLNEQSSDNRVFKKTELKSIDFDDIFFNSDNRFPMSELMELQESIKEKGLLNPPVVYPFGDGTYMLLSGHRRLTAIKPLINSGAIPPEIKCLVVPEPTDEISEVETIFLANKNRPPLTEAELRVCVNQLIDTWNMKPREERKGRMRDYIASYLNISPRSLQKYINEYNGTSDTEEIENDKQEETKKIKKKTKNALSKNSSIAEQIETLGIDLYDEHIVVQGKSISLNDSLLLLHELSNEIIKLLDCMGN
jgi:Predicted transcriptional regulators